MIFLSVLVFHFIFIQVGFFRFHWCLTSQTDILFIAITYYQCISSITIVICWFRLHFIAFRFYRNVCKVNKNYPQRNFDTYFRHLTECWPKFPFKNCPKNADKKPLDCTECRLNKNIHEWFLCKLLRYIFSTLSISLADTSFGCYA